ncbi:hypothetical protein EB75_26520 [Mycobacterium sp. ST-F2]|nr:hypothetical protein EB75_26520 [Mycobacterium sp. ST-F2]
MVRALTETGKMKAAPIPCNARNPMITAAVGASAQPTEAMPNRAIPPSSARRRPKMSPMRPAGTMKAPRVSM